MLNKKMLLAPILAITLALFLAGTVSFLPQTIVTHATPLPTAVALAATNSNMVVLFFGIAALLVGVVVAFLFFSEKKLNKEIKG